MVVTISWNTEAGESPMAKGFPCHAMWLLCTRQELHAFADYAVLG